MGFLGCVSDLEGHLAGSSTSEPEADAGPQDDDVPMAPEPAAPIPEPTVPNVGGAGGEAPDPPAGPFDPDAGSGGSAGTSDAGTGGEPPVVDSGLLVVDSGPPVVDSGPPAVDSGPLAVDSGGPLGLIVTGSTPAPGATAVDPATDLVLDFDQDVIAGSGEITAFDPEGAVESVAAQDARVTINGGTVTIDFEGILAPNTVHSFRVDADAFTTVGGDALETAATIGFTTAVIEVPGGLGAGPLLWLDAAYPPSVHEEDGVRVWADRSGNQLNMVQAAASSRPSLDSSGVGNSPAISFDGIDDFLLGPRLGALDDYDVFIVWESSESVGSTTQLLLRVEGTLEVTHGHASAIVRRAVSLFAGGEWRTAAFRAPSPDAPTLWNFTAANDTEALYARSQGGAPLVTLMSAPPPALQEPLTIAAGEAGEGPFAFRLAELVLFDRKLTSEERTSVDAALREKWGFADPTCGSGEALGPDGSCYVVVPASTWAQARAACVAGGPGWDLASIHSAAENGFVASLVSTPTWISATDQDTPGQWVWAQDGAALFDASTATVADGEFAAWAPGEPTAVAHCARVGATGQWDAAACAENHPALCRGPGN